MCPAGSDDNELFMNQVKNPKFIHRVTSASGSDSDNSYLINEPGSVHLSYTTDDGAILLLLWSGKHVYFHKDGQPEEGSIPALGDSGSPYILPR